jgi:hypothetical protein
LQVLGFLVRGRPPRGFFRSVIDMTVTSA